MKVGLNNFINIGKIALFQPFIKNNQRALMGSHMTCNFYTPPHLLIMKEVQN